MFEQNSTQYTKQMPKFKHSSLKKVLNCCQYYLFSSNGVVFTNKVKTLPGFSFTMPPVIKLNFQVFVGLDDFNTFFVFPWNDQLISPQTSCIMGSCNWSGWLRRDNNSGVGRSDCVPDKRFKEKKTKNTEALLFDAVLVYKSKVNQSSGGQVLRFSL